MPKLRDLLPIRKAAGAELAIIDPRIRQSDVATVDQAGIPPEVYQAMAAAKMNAGARFGPGAPLTPLEGFGGEARAWDFPAGYNIVGRPDRDRRVSFEVLKGLIDHYDIARMAIGHRIDGVRSLKFSIVPKRGELGDVTAAVDRAYELMNKPDGKRPFHTWLAMYLEDLLRYDAGVLAKRRDRAGRVLGLRVVSGTTIAPVLDQYGDTPDGDAPAYVQVVQGVPWKWFPARDLIYVPFRPQADSPYGFAPLEAILINANTDVRFQMHFLNYFTEGTVPAGFATAPTGFSTPDQLEEYQEYFDALCYGDDAAKHQIKWIADGTKFEWPRDPSFDEKFPLFMLRKTAAAYHVTPNDLGFTDDVNRASSEAQMDVSQRTGDVPLAQHLNWIFTAYLQDDHQLPVEFQFETGEEKEDRVSEATAWQIYINSGMASADEGRVQVLGLPIDEARPVPRFINNARSGPIPIASIEAVSGKIDPETAAPATDAQLPTTVFTPIPGVAPATAPKTPALAEREFGPDAGMAPSVPGVDATAAATSAGVAKAMTDGITGATGIYGADLMHDDQDKDNTKPVTQSVFLEQESGPDGVPVAALDDVEHLAKAEMTVTVSCAGLVVKADDTGRVLLLQRALDDTDPASGTWEFPGGHLEVDETPLDGACREWCEEVGAELPAGRIVSSWVAPGGVWAGFIYCIPAESAIQINLAEGRVLNPDDPDGDCVETVAWFDPADLADMPSLRAECGTTPWDLLTAAALPDGEDLRKTLRQWKVNSKARVKIGKAPRAFPELDMAIAVPIWKQLAGATERNQVDAAFITVIKAGDARPKVRRREPSTRLPIHAYDLKIVDHYSPQILEALAAAFPDSLLRAGIAAAQALVAKADEAEDDLFSNAAREAMAEHTPSLEMLADVVRQLYGDGYLASAHTTGDMAGGRVVASMGDVNAATNWASWTPGDPHAALQAADGGLAALLEQADVTIKGIHDTTLDRLGNAIADGIGRGSNMDTVAASLSDIVSDPRRAEMIATTETARAITAASLDTYRQNEIGLIDWLVSDPCDVCDNNAADGPYEVDEFPELPAHPHCRCSSAPHFDEASLSADAADAAIADDGSAEAVAAMLIDAATAAEPELTNLVSSLAEQHDGELAGLDFRLKGVDSLTRKIAGDVASTGDSAEYIASKMFDVNRYTTVFGEEQYAGSAQATLDALREQGHKLNVKNYWNNDANPYQGVNVQVVSPDGHKWELQFHTPKSLDVKEGALHRIYEKARVETDPARLQEYTAQSFDVAAQIPVPPGVGSVH